MKEGWVGGREGGRENDLLGIYMSETVLGIKDAVMNTIKFLPS